MRALLLLFLLWAGTQVEAQKLEPTSLKYPDTVGNGHSVVLDYDVYYEVTGLDEATISYRKVITLLNSSHQYGNVLTEFYDSESKITHFAAAGYDRFGREYYKSRNADVEDRRYTSEVSFYEDTRYKQLTVPCNEYPCTVVYEVTMKARNAMILNFPHWQPQGRGEGLVRSTYNAEVPVINELLYRANKLDQPTVSENGKTRKYRWVVDHREAQNDEPFAPPATLTLPYLRVALADFEVDGYLGSYRDWKRYGDFRALIMSGRDELPPSLATKVQELIEGAQTEYEKIDRLYRFMQRRMRYVSIQLGLGGLQPFSAAYVEQNRFGDCKALSNYMGAMLKEVDIASYPVLVRWDNQEPYPMTEEFATHSSNHMILYVPSQDMYLECTSHTDPTGYLGEGKEDRNVLWVTPTGGELHRTPKLLPSENGYTRTLDIALAADQPTDLSISSTFYGGAQEFFRQLDDYQSNVTDQLQYLHRTDRLPNVSGSLYSLTADPAAPRVTLNYLTKVENYARKMGSRLFVPINPYYGHTEVPDDDANRQLPIVTTTTRYYVDTVNIALPPNMEIESGLIDTPATYQHAGREYRAEMRPTDDGLQWIRTLKLVPVNLPAEAYADFRQFYLDVSKAERAQIVVRERRTK